MIFLHDSVIVSHGKLHPGNCTVDSRWVLQLCDFGLHQLVNSDSIIQDENKYYKGILFTLTLAILVWPTVFRVLYTQYVREPISLEKSSSVAVFHFRPSLADILIIYLNQLCNSGT